MTRSPRSSRPPPLTDLLTADQTDQNSRSFVSTLLSSFTPLTSEQVLDLIKKYPIKSCPLDPVPAVLFKTCIPVILPVVTAIVNLSLESRIVPTSLKEGHLSSIIKKHKLDPNIYNNYSPISNLPYLSKLVECTVTKQLNDHMAAHNLLEPLQAAYPKYHSTETAILYVLTS